MGAAGGLVLVASLLVAGAPASAAVGDEHLAGLEYVALGDSYAAGFGLTPLTGLPVPGCAQSSANYPHQVAAELGLALTDVTCSGATADNLTTTEQVTPAGTAPVQNASLSASTDIVTVTIGGNDLGFVEILMNCAALSPAGPVVAGGSDCDTFYNTGGIDSLAAAIDGTVATALESTFAAITAAAPNAKVLVIGYPALTPSTLPEGGCFREAADASTFDPPFPENAYPYLDVDVAYLHTVEMRLDQAIADVAAANGATYVSTLTGTDAHSPCATVDPYVAGITVIDLTLFPAVVVELAPGGMHPNALGAGYLAAQVEDAIRDAFPASTGPGGDTGGDTGGDNGDGTETASDGEALAVTGSESGGWLALGGILLLLAGGVVLGRGRVAARR